jgi:NitT/TauT family transport system ATP-binding protein
MIKFNKVYFQYDQNAIFEDFSCSFSEQKINCIVGPSGCGKTTMLNMVANIIKPTRGSILGLNKHVSYLFQEERLINEITVFKNLDFILKGPYKDASERKNIIIEGLNSVDLKETIDMFPNQLSGSMKRRLALLRAFLYPSKILLMDEPFSGLDINIKQQIIKLFIDL